MNIKKFKNMPHKLSTILSVFESGETLSTREIAKRVRHKGYKMNDAHLRTFIYHNMLYKFIERERVRGTNIYKAIGS